MLQAIITGWDLEGDTCRRGTYAIVEPVPRCTDEDGPVVGVIVISVFVKEVTGTVAGLSVGQSLQ